MSATPAGRRWRNSTDDDEEHPRAVNKHLTKDTARRMAAKFCDAARLSYQLTYLNVVEGWRLRRRKMVEVQKTARPPFGIT